MPNLYIEAMSSILLLGTEIKIWLKVWNNLEKSAKHKKNSRKIATYISYQNQIFASFIIHFVAWPSRIYIYLYIIKLCHFLLSASKLFNFCFNLSAIYTLLKPLYKSYHDILKQRNSYHLTGNIMNNDCYIFSIFFSFQRWSELLLWPFQNSCS